MKLTKFTLKQIIKEEINKVLREQEIGDPTVQPIRPDDPRFMDESNLTTDALVLYKAMEGWGTDEEAIEEVLSKYVGPGHVLGDPAGARKVHQLVNTFNNLPQVKRQKARYGGLVDWLKDDGEDEWARLISQDLKLIGPIGTGPPEWRPPQEVGSGTREDPFIIPPIPPQTSRPQVARKQKWCLYTSRRGNEKLEVETEWKSLRNMIKGQEWRYVFDQLGVKCNRLPCKWKGKTIYRVEAAGEDGSGNCG